MPRAKFKHSVLNTKIKRHENIEERRRESLPLLIQEFGLNPADFDMETTNPWRELCMKMAKVLVPAFQERKSGRRPEYTFAEDYPIISEYLACLDFCDSISVVYRKRKGTLIKEIADKHEKTVSEVRTAIQRYERHRRTYPTLYEKASFPYAVTSDTDFSAAEPKTDYRYFGPELLKAE